MKKTVLISGAGIAGPTLAYWLLRYGYAPTLCERASAMRTGGYVVDFWGRGYDVAERMRLLPKIKADGYEVEEVRFVDAEGRRVGGFPRSAIVGAIGGRFTSVARSDLARALFRSVENECETIFGDSVDALEPDQNGVRAVFAHGHERSFDLVIGADGLHSRVRDLAFGPERHFEKYLGYGVAAFQATGYTPRNDNIYLAHSEPGRQIARFSMHDDRTLFLFVFAAKEFPEIEAHDAAGQKALLRRLFGGDGWEAPQILDALDATDDLYFDRVSQIRMDSWSNGRIALVGDAAYSVSLLSGQGAALAMTGAYVLAGEIARAQGRPEIAFPAYEATLRDYIDGKQQSAENFASSFAPHSRMGIFVRNQVTKLMAIAPIARLVFGRTLVDQLSLPEYAENR